MPFISLFCGEKKNLLRGKIFQEFGLTSKDKSKKRSLKTFKLNYTLRANNELNSLRIRTLERASNLASLCI